MPGKLFLDYAPVCRYRYGMLAGKSAKLVQINGRLHVCKLVAAAVNTIAVVFPVMA